MAKKGTTKYKSDLQEKQVSKDVEGVTVIASGALWGSKGDVRTDTMLIECKTTEKLEYRLTLKVWDKIRREAIKDGLRTPVMCVELDDGNTKLAVFEERAFDHYVDWYEYRPLETIYQEEHISILLHAHRPWGYHTCKVLFDKNGDTHTSLIVMSWRDFLNLIRKGTA